MRHSIFYIIVQVIFILLTVSISFSCSRRDLSKERLEAALIFSEDNREELERVLEHYQDDSLKLEAAKFLIRNMPYYYTYKGGYMDRLYKALDQVSDSGRYDKAKYDNLKPFPYKRLIKEYDVRVIKADYLIENIDYSFKVWNERPWGKYISFDNFCEFILPYRIKDEPLTHWKKDFYHRYTPVLDSLYQGTDVVGACTALNHYLIDLDWTACSEFNAPHLPADYLIEKRVGDCRDITDFVVYIMRSVGIPVATDFYFYSPTKQYGHFWNVLLDTTGVVLSFFTSDFDPRRDEQVGYVKGKAYRRCFGLQPDRMAILEKGFNIPVPLNDFFLKDASSDYFPTDDIYVDCDYIASSSARPVWLATFSPRRWIPIGEGEYKEGKACFRHVEPGLFYATLYSDEKGNLLPAGPAFKIDPETGTVLHFRPEGNNNRIVLKRKYPFSEDCALFLERMKSGKFEASNSKDFKDADILYQIKYRPEGKYYTVDIQNTKKYRYVRYISDPIHSGDIAELAFYEGRGKGEALNGEAMSSLPYKKIPEFDPENAFDGDRLTYFSGATWPGWVGLDLGEPKTIGQIKYMPRNDDNFIRVGDTYELFYYSEAGWKSLGVKVADTGELIYDNAPCHALFWLRNLTRGKEEQVFSYQNGKQNFNLKEVLY